MKLTIEIDRKTDNPTACGACPFHAGDWVFGERPPDFVPFCSMPAWDGARVDAGRHAACLAAEQAAGAAEPVVAAGRHLMSWGWQYQLVDSPLADQCRADAARLDEALKAVGEEKA